MSNVMAICDRLLATPLASPDFSWLGFSLDLSGSIFDGLFSGSQAQNQNQDHFSTISSGLNSLAAIGLRDFLPASTRSKMGESWQVIFYHNLNVDAEKRETTMHIVKIRLW